MNAELIQEQINQLDIELYSVDDAIEAALSYKEEKELLRKRDSLFKRKKKLVRRLERSHD